MVFLPNKSVKLWRLVPANSQHNPFCGEGASRFGGRWNPKGFSLIYTSSSISLAMLEILANLRGIRSNPMYHAFPVNIPLEHIQILSLDSLPKNWNQPSNRIITQEIGAQWIESKESLALKVPSAVNLHEFNYIINPNHSQFSNLALPRPKEALNLELDPRLIHNI